MTPRIAALFAATAAALLATMGTADAAGWQMVARYDMNEPTGATVLLDTVGGHNGSIGAHVLIGGGHGVHNYLGPQPVMPDPARLDTLPVGVLNPGSRDVRITVWLHSTQATSGHFVTWGQSPNQMIRMSLSYGGLACGWRGTNNNFVQLVDRTRPWNDGQWHQLVCTKTANQISLRVDAAPTLVKTVTVGSITPPIGMAFGGKRSCTGDPTHDCDYFVGQINSITVDESSVS